MDMFLLLAASTVLGSAWAAPTEMSIDPNSPKTWMGTCGNNEEDITLFKAKMETMQRCYENVFNTSTGLPKELVESGGNSSETDQDPCTALTSYVACVDDFLSALQHCFDEGHQNDMKSTIGATKAMFTEICDGLAREIKNASSTPDDVECMQGKDKELFACFEERAEDTDLAEVMPDDNMAVALLEMTYDENTCRTLHDVWHCVTDVFGTCPNNAITPILQNGMYQYYEMTPCKQMLTTENPAFTTTAFSFF